MRLVCMSDTHNQFKYFNHSVPDGDCFIFTGDISGNSLEEINVKQLNVFINNLPHKHKIIIAGNHDFIFQNKNGKDLIYGHGVHYLEDSGVEIDGVKIWGTPAQPIFFNWSFNFNSYDLKNKFDLIPVDTNVLLTHCPPYEILDLTDDNRNVGCPILANRLNYLTDLKAHCFGHIHNSYGTLVKNGVQFVNGCTCDEEYKPVNKPIVIDI